MKKFLKLGKGLKRSTSQSSSNWSINSAGSKESLGKSSASSAEFREKDFHKIHKAALNGDLEKLKEHLKKQKVNAVDKQKRTPLHVACRQGHEEIVRYLLKDAFADVNAADAEGASPLIHAIQGRNQIICEELLKFEAEVNAKDQFGATPLHHAAGEGLGDVIALLIENDANIDAEDSDRRTPLQYACQRGHDESAAYLLHERANPDSRDKTGRTPLMLAAQAGSLPTANALIRHGADPTIKDSSKFTAADYAFKANHNDVLHFVQTHIKRVKERGLRKEEEEDDDDEEEDDHRPSATKNHEEEENEKIERAAGEGDQGRASRASVDSWGDDVDDEDVGATTAPKSLNLKNDSLRKSESFDEEDDDDDDDDVGDFGVSRASIRRKSSAEGSIGATEPKEAPTSPLIPDDDSDDNFDDNSWMEKDRKKSAASVLPAKCSSNFSLSEEEKKPKPQLNLLKFLSKDGDDDDDDDDLDDIINARPSSGSKTKQPSMDEEQTPSRKRPSTMGANSGGKAPADKTAQLERGSAVSTPMEIATASTRSRSSSPSKIPRRVSNASEISPRGSQPSSARSSVSSFGDAASKIPRLVQQQQKPQQDSNLDSWDDDNDDDLIGDETKPPPIITKPSPSAVDETKPTPLAKSMDDESDWDDDVDFAVTPKATMKRVEPEKVPASIEKAASSTADATDSTRRRSLLADLGIDADELDKDVSSLSEDDEDDDDDFQMMVVGEKREKPSPEIKTADKEIPRSSIFDSGVTTNSPEKPPSALPPQAPPVEIPKEAPDIEVPNTNSVISRLDSEKWDCDDDDDEKAPTVMANGSSPPRPMPRVNAAKAKAQKEMRQSGGGGEPIVDDDAARNSRSSSKRGYCIWEGDEGDGKASTLDRTSEKDASHIGGVFNDVDDDEEGDIDNDALADFLNLENALIPQSPALVGMTVPSALARSSSPVKCRPNGVSKLDLGFEEDVVLGESARRDDELSIPRVSPISLQSGIPLSRRASSQVEALPPTAAFGSGDGAGEEDEADKELPPLVYANEIALPRKPERRRLPATPQITVDPVANRSFSRSTLASSFDEDEDDEDILSTGREIDFLNDSKTSAGVSPLTTPVVDGGMTESPTGKTSLLRPLLEKSVIGFGSMYPSQPGTENTTPISMATPKIAENKSDNEDVVSGIEPAEKNSEVKASIPPFNFNTNNAVGRESDGGRFTTDADSSGDDSYPIISNHALLASALNPDLAQMYGYNSSQAHKLDGAGEGQDKSLLSNSTKSPILDALHQQTEALAKERGAKEASLAKAKILDGQIQSLKRQSEDGQKRYRVLEEQNLSLENEITQMRKKVEEETQLRKNAETLQKKLKDQLMERHNRYGSDMEEKQTLEMNLRDLGLQVASLEANLRHVEMERDQFSRELTEERDANFELEKKVKDLECKMLSVKEEWSENKCNVMEELQSAARSKLEAETKLKHTEQELRMLKDEMEKTHKQLEETRNYSKKEAEENLKKMMEVREEKGKLSADIVRMEVEKASEIMALNSEISMLKSKIQEHMRERDRYESLVKEMNNKNDQSVRDSEKMNNIKNEAEQKLRDEVHKGKILAEEKDKEGKHMREAIKCLEKTKENLRDKLESLQSELSKYERRSDVSNQEVKSVTESYEAKIARLQEDWTDVKVSIAAECQSLKAQLSSKNDEVLGLKFENEKLNKQLSVLEAQAKNFGSVDAKVIDGMTIAKEAYTKGMDSLLQRIDAQQNQLSSLIQQNQDAQDMKKHLELEKFELEKKVLRMDELQNNLKNISEERNVFKQDNQQLSRKLEITQEKLSNTEKHLEEFRGRVERTERESLEATAALRDLSSREGEGNRTRDQLQVDLAKTAGALEMQTSKYETLRERFDEAESERKQLKKQNRSLIDEKEELSSRLTKETNKNLALDKEMQTINDAYQAEVNSKAVQGLKMAQMTRQTQEKLLESQTWELRIKEANERKKSAEKHFEEEKKKRRELEEENINIKSYLKDMRKKQKDINNERGSFHAMASDFEKERQQYELAIQTMQANLKQLQEALEHERDTVRASYDKAVLLEKEVEHHKSLEKRYKKLLRSKDKPEEERAASVPPLKLLHSNLVDGGVGIIGPKEMNVAVPKAFEDRESQPPAPNVASSNEDFLNNLREEYDRSRNELLEEIEEISRCSTPSAPKRKAHGAAGDVTNHTVPAFLSHFTPNYNHLNSVISTYDPLNSALINRPPRGTSTPIASPSNRSGPPVNSYTNHYRKELEKSIKRSLLPNIADF